MIRMLMLDLKSYYDSPAYQLALCVSYAKLDEKVRQGVEFKFSEQPRSNPAEDIAKHIIEEDVDLVAMSNYSWNYKKICELLKELEKYDKVPRILLGGPNSAGKFGVAMMGQYPLITAMVEGEGEPAFRDICLNMVEGKQNPFEGARNTLFRDKTGTIHKPEKLHRIESLDEIPSPYLEGIIPLKPAPLFYETNRGCPYRCTFCYWGNGNSKLYRMSHERVKEEMEFFAKNKVGALFLADANFGIFPGDLEIAEIICDINEKNGRPLKFVGVNWAKNSSDRILDIASVFRDSGIAVATTLALQSVTAKAEEISKRYAMPPSRFVNLIKNAEMRGIDTYTDLIWGLPGEGLHEFIQGLEAVICTGVPSLMIHQLSLLPGTELYDSKEELDIQILSDIQPDLSVDPATMSDYAEYIVVSHADMTYEEMKTGTRMMGIAHILHNHGLGRVVNFVLMRWGASIYEVYRLFDQVLRGEHLEAFKEHEEFISGMNHILTEFAEGTGNDETIFYRNLSEFIWFDQPKSGLRKVRGEEVLSFIIDFYNHVIDRLALDVREWEAGLIREITRYGWLISPKPTWRSKDSFEFQFDVHAIWADLMECLFASGIDEKSAKENKKAGITFEWDNWRALPGAVRDRIEDLFTDDYLKSKEDKVIYSVKNPWVIPPSKKNIDWLLRARSVYCNVSYEGQQELAETA